MPGDTLEGLPASVGDALEGLPADAGAIILGGLVLGYYLRKITPPTQMVRPANAFFEGK